MSQAVIEHKASTGYLDYVPGMISVGNIIPYYNANADKQQDYKFAKIECENKGDYDALVEMKYINIEGNVSRLLPNMTKEDIAKYFNN